VKPGLALWVVIAGILGAQNPESDRAKLDLGSIRSLPVLSHTRFQPLESYARDAVLNVTGEVEPKRNKDGTAPRRGGGQKKRGDPLLTYLDWWLTPEDARTVPWILVDRPGTRKLLGLPESDPDYERATFDELFTNKGFHDLAETLRNRPKESLNLDEAELLRVYGRLGGFAHAAGYLPEQRQLPEGLRGGPDIVPPKGAMVRGVRYDWFPIGRLAADASALGWSEAQSAAVTAAYVSLRDAYVRGDQPAFDAGAAALRSAIESLGSPHVPDAARLEREVRYHRGHYFNHAAWCYLLSFILAIFSSIWKNRVLHVAAAMPGVVGLVLNVYGLAERTALSERALLGNLYETLLFLGAVTFVLAIVCEGIFRSRWVLMTGSLLAMVFLRISQDHALLLNPGISVLQPVLDKNFWIHIHVPVIVASYAPLMLSALMGNLFLLITIFRPSAEGAQKEIGRIQYWAMIPGVILLFAGLILGGVWADASWGRFWGWDPKETWGFITWVAFVVLIHGRWSGWLRDFGTAVGTLVGGACLVMTYWGVNFLLPGLHSYASANDGNAGLPWWKRISAWVFGYVGFEIALVVAAAFLRRPAPAQTPAVEPAA
jgi:ABC-type transport system involved in cytochrome c biogenesis permease subunit